MMTFVFQLASSLMSVVGSWQGTLESEITWPWDTVTAAIMRTHCEYSFVQHHCNFEQLLNE